uniref:Arp2/3 complex 34 kDa subunit n=1 Tax=Rhabditophanes sp. KR3021 TaxID=114890 RepID=A0AC35TS22_9BILA
MIILEINNRIIIETLTVKFNDAINGVRLTQINSEFCDFDGVNFKISNHSDDRKLLKVSIYLKYYNELKNHGAEVVLKRTYGDYLMPQAEEGYNVSLLYDLEKIPKQFESIVLAASFLKRNCFAAVFEKYFEFQQTGDQTHDKAVIHYRDDETLYVEAKPDRVTVIFATQFKDPADVAIGNIFLHQFQEGRKATKTAPQVLYSIGEPPGEMINLERPMKGDNVFYVAFVLEKRHIGKEVRDNTIDLLHLFRDNLHYHIKCSKAYVHSRMLSKYNDFRKILDRAHQKASANENTTSGDGTAVKKGMVRKNF